MAFFVGVGVVFMFYFSLGGGCFFIFRFLGLLFFFMFCFLFLVFTCVFSFVFCFYFVLHTRLRSTYDINIDIWDLKQIEIKQFLINGRFVLFLVPFNIHKPWYSFLPKKSEKTTCHVFSNVRPISPGILFWPWVCFSLITIASCSAIISYELFIIILLDPYHVNKYKYGFSNKNSTRYQLIPGGGREYTVVPWFDWMVLYANFSSISAISWRFNYHLDPSQLHVYIHLPQIL